MGIKAIETSATHHTLHQIPNTQLYLQDDGIISPGHVKPAS